MVRSCSERATGWRAEGLMTKDSGGRERTGRLGASSPGDHRRLAARRTSDAQSDAWYVIVFIGDIYNRELRRTL